MKVLEYLERHGCYGRFVSIEHLEDLRNEVRGLHSDGQLENDFFVEWVKSRLEPKRPRGMSKARSILITATPTPAVRTTFRHKGQVYHFTVPPTYGHYGRVSTRSWRLLKEALAPKEYWIARAVLPAKLLAVRSGLALYGRNNITYIPKYGSFHTLAALYTDYVSPEYHWQEKEMLEKCHKCRACQKACPTGAIAGDRFLLHAERCIPRWNELVSSRPFPEWMAPSAHNSVIGCVKCQNACPYDRDIIGWHVNRGRFSEAETAYLLKGEFSGAKAAAMDKKLKRIGLDLTIFPRNLKALLDLQG